MISLILQFNTKVKSLKRSWLLIKIVSDFFSLPRLYCIGYTDWDCNAKLSRQSYSKLVKSNFNHTSVWSVHHTVSKLYIHTVSQKNNKKINKGYCDCCSLQCCYIFYCAACAFLQCPLWESANHKIPLRLRLLFGGTFFS